MLREVTVKIGLERIDIQEEVTVEALLDSRATRLVIDRTFNKKGPIKTLWRLIFIIRNTGREQR